LLLISPLSPDYAHYASLFSRFSFRDYALAIEIIDFSPFALLPLRLRLDDFAAMPLDAAAACLFRQYLFRCRA